MQSTSTPYLSVIIPSYNRAEKLDRCLNALYTQSLAKEAYEVWVVDDGSKDNTSEILDQWKATWPNLNTLKQNNQGQSAARKNALHHAKGQIILFIGDDIYGTKNFLKEHTDFHLNHPEESHAALGLTEWYPQAEINPYMQWLTHGGPQFAYHKLKAHEHASFWFFYTSNISLKKSLLEKESFDTNFKGYGWEDIELGYRLEKHHNLKLFFTPEALAYHEHHLEETELEKKMFAIGKNGYVFEAKHPELKVLPHGLKKWIFKIATVAMVRASLNMISKKISQLKPLYWTLESKHQLLKAMHQSKEGQPEKT